MAPHNPMSMPCLPKSLARVHSLFPALVLLASATGFLSLATPAVAQETSVSPPAAVQTAARAKPAAQWPNRGSEPGGATQPKVTFEDGLLSVSASNSSLADILFAVHSITGADIDIPNNASAERVTAQLGPGPARKVLADLLGWSNFDYIIQGSDTDALAIQSVTLMVRTKGTGATSTAVMDSTKRISSSSGSTASETVNIPVAAETPETQVVPEQPTPSQPNSIAQSMDRPVSGVPVAPTGVDNSGKSTSEMIQELQQMYNQRKTMQAPQAQTSGTKAP